MIIVFKITFSKSSRKSMSQCVVVVREATEAAFSLIKVISLESAHSRSAENIKRQIVRSNNKAK